MVVAVVVGIGGEWSGVAVVAVVVVVGRRSLW